MSRPLARRALLLASLGSILTLAACGADDGTSDFGAFDGEDTVVVGPNGEARFSPSTLRVLIGTTVTFRFASAGHNVVSGAGCSADGVFCSPDDTDCANAPTSAGGTYTRTFRARGTYRYFSAPACAQGMTGTIIVE